MICSESKEETIGVLESLQAVCNAKADMSIGKGKILWAGYGKAAGDAITLLKEQEEEHRRLLSWLGKFCRHIDNGDAWLTDEENIAFFKEKMKQQFGWNTD